MTATRGRPRKFDRDAALDVAMKIFWQKGFTAASLADLCGGMGISSPSLYAAFGSKEELYEEALQHYAVTTGPPLWAMMERAPRAREAIEGLLMNSAAAFPASEKPAGCMATLSTVGEEGEARLGAIVAKMNADTLALVEARLAKAVTEGDVPATIDVKTLARFYRGVQQGMAVQARNGANRRQLEAFASAAMAAWPSLIQMHVTRPVKRRPSHKRVKRCDLSPNKVHHG
jgi:AcrR family transcriptional regulator